MAERRILVLGAGGHGKAVLDLLLARGDLTCIGVVDDAVHGGSLLGVPIIGGESAARAAFAEGVALAHPAIGNNAVRWAAGDRLEAWGFALPILLHPSAIIGHGARLEDGAAIMARAVIGPEARIGRLALINTGAIVEHDAEVGEGAHLGPGAVLAGGVRLGARALIGAGAVVRPGITIGEDAVVGAGAAVVANVPAGALITGVPGR